jgi:uncharacterized protein YcnI
VLAVSYVRRRRGACPRWGGSPVAGELLEPPRLANPISLVTRAVLAGVALAALMTLGLSVGTASAWAHVHVWADHAVRGGQAILTFEVPNESETGSPTTQLSVTLPDATSASTEALPGWTARLDRDTAAGTVRTVTWTAAPGGGIGPDEFALFRLAVTLPKTETASFPATQIYADGTVVRWDQPPLPTGNHPEHPAPVLTLRAAAPDTAQHTAVPATDSTARWLGGSGIAAGLLGLGLALVRLRRP